MNTTHGKRLYSEIEPLLFQLYEALEEAHYRVRSLTRTSRNHNLPDWLAGQGYYLNSTVYKLIVPAVFLRLIQRQMTFVDLRVDETIRVRYQLLKLYSRSFTDDYIFASVEPSLRYDPNNEDWRKLRSKDPATYMRQALVVGDLENICDAMIIAESNQHPRAMAFSEFEKYLSLSDKNESLQEILALFLGFSPMDRPVLARMLVSQAVMAQIILTTYNQTTGVEDLQSRLESITSSTKTGRALAWEDSAVSGDLQIARKYWDERLRWLGHGNSWIEIDG